MSSFVLNLRKCYRIEKLPTKQHLNTIPPIDKALTEYERLKMKRDARQK